MYEFLCIYDFLGYRLRELLLFNSDENLIFLWYLYIVMKLLNFL